MLKGLKYIVTGLLFGIALSKAEVISWYRIYEMFLFDAFHMYGIIGLAVVLGILIVFFIKKTHAKDAKGNEIVIADKRMGYKNYLLGGVIFGLGWALTGACPGPMYILLGYGYSVILVVILSALLGTFVYGLLRDRLPH